MKRTILFRTLVAFFCLVVLSTTVPAQVIQTSLPDVPYFTSAPTGIVGSANYNQPPNLAQFWNFSVQHPAQKVFGLGDAVLLREAAALQLASKGQSTSPPNVDSLLQQLQQDPVARWQFAPHLLRVAFDALAAPSPNAAQRSFRQAFEKYMSYAEFKIAQDTRTSWRMFSGQPVAGFGNVAPPAKYQPGSTLGNMLPKYPKVSEFLKTESPNGSMEVGNNGRVTIEMVLAPAVASNFPDYDNRPFKELGKEINGTAAATGLGAGAGQAAASLLLVSSAILGFTLKVGAIGSSVFVTVTPAMVAGGQILGHVSFAFMAGAGVGIALGFAFVLAMVFADVIKSQQYDKILNDAVRAGPISVDVSSLVNPKFEYDAGLWYPVCRAGNKGVAT
ncbi:MAG: hypothetical protein WBD27_05120 [Pyrinomonadaceae bacterium]